MDVYEDEPSLATEQLPSQNHEDIQQLQHLDRHFSNHHSILDGVTEAGSSTTQATNYKLLAGTQALSKFRDEKPFPGLSDHY